MKCFIHQMIDAIGTCKTCGKAMCVNCSAYSNHTGICPICRKDEYIVETNSKKQDIANLQNKKKMSIFWISVITIALVALAIYLKSAIPLAFFPINLFFIFRFLYVNNKIKPLRQRVNWLDEEIAKINQSLLVGKSELLV